MLLLSQIIPKTILKNQSKNKAKFKEIYECTGGKPP